MRQTEKKLWSLLLCLLLLCMISVPVWAANEHSDQVISVDIQRTGKRNENGTEILLVTVVTTPAVKYVEFENGHFQPYTTNLELIGTTEDGNLIWQQTRENGRFFNLLQLGWDDENGMRQVEWQAFDYPEPMPVPQPAEALCRWCGNSHGGGFDAIIAWFHNLFVQLFGERY